MLWLYQFQCTYVYNHGIPQSRGHDNREAEMVLLNSREKWEKKETKKREKEQPVCEDKKQVEQSLLWQLGCTLLQPMQTVSIVIVATEITESFTVSLKKLLNIIKSDRCDNFCILLQHFYRV